MGLRYTTAVKHDKLDPRQMEISTQHCHLMGFHIEEPAENLVGESAGVG